MFEIPHVVAEQTFQLSWLGAARHLSQNGWECGNLVVRIADPTAFDGDLHARYADFARDNALLPPKDVAYTIFPVGLYRSTDGAARVFDRYNRTGGMFDRLRKRPRRGWGTYFRRMTHYETRDQQPVNQLGNIIEALNARRKVCRAAYTVVIQRPGGETTRPLGGPCLNYIAVQAQPGEPRTLGLLCVYRNHDFLERAYGNYWGLCNLLSFLAAETRSQSGPIACVSSHAYVETAHGRLLAFIGSLP